MAATRVAINGFGRMGRLALRAAWNREDLQFVHVNELHGDAATAAHLLYFDSVHGRCHHEVSGDGDVLSVDGQQITYSAAAAPGELPWSEHGAQIVLECSGRFRTIVSPAPYFEQGVRKVIVAAPVKDDRALNVVVGVNDARYDPAVHDVVTAASCTTNCLAPLGSEHTVDVMTAIQGRSPWMRATGAGGAGRGYSASCGLRARMIAETACSWTR